jgi:hypothetical protein
MSSSTSIGIHGKFSGMHSATYVHNNWHGWRVLSGVLEAEKLHGRSSLFSRGSELPAPTLDRTLISVLRLFGE